MKNRAFTLIELLVVVLIIGILAAIALPQYQKAVMNSRLTQMLVYMDALRKGSDIYYMTNGVAPNDVRDIDIDITGSAARIEQTSITHDTGVMAAIFEDGTDCMVNKGVVACINENFYLLETHTYAIDGYTAYPKGMLCVGYNDAAESACKSRSIEEIEFSGITWSKIK